MSVNVAVRQLVDTRFPDVVAETLARHNLAPEVLCLELTETGDTDAWTAVSETLQRLRDMGVRIAIDDLGTGYATLERLRNLPVDVVKLDATHVGKVGESPVDTAIVRALAELASALDVSLVAEGVETDEVHAQLRALGCTLGQGYLLDGRCRRRTSRRSSGQISPTAKPPDLAFSKSDPEFAQRSQKV